MSGKTRAKRKQIQDEQLHPKTLYVHAQEEESGPDKYTSRDVGETVESHLVRGVPITLGVYKLVAIRRVVKVEVTRELKRKAVRR